MRMQGVWVIILSVIFLAGLDGCTSAEKREQERSWRKLHRVVLKNLKVRRPPGNGADPAVGPGGEGYRSTPLPAANFDCESTRALFFGIPLAPLKVCFASIAEGTAAHYRLRRVPQPFWELQVNDATPRCLADSLPKIPVPREIVFQSKEDGPIACYSSRLNVEADDVAWLGVKWPLSPTLLRVEFPPTPGVPLVTDEQLTELLLTWSLRPFFNERNELLSRYLPQSLCEACLGREQLIRPQDPMPPQWPED